MREKQPCTKFEAREPFASLPLFEQNSASAALPGSLNDDALVRSVLVSAIKRSGKSREQIADDMGRLLGVLVTARMLACFTAESKELHRWPGAWDRAFCAAVNDNRLLFCCVEAAGFRVITNEEAGLLELGRQYLIQKRSEQSIVLLERRLAGADL
jgi:hypothetical protein